MLCVVLWSSAFAQDEKPKPSLEIVSPAANAEVAGTVTVKVTTLPAEIPASHVMCALNGPPFAPMVRVGETSEWTLDLDTSLYPSGDATLIVVANMLPAAKRVQQTSAVRLANGAMLFWGDIHSHTYYSDGTLLPEDAHRYARDVAKLDFFVLTDHLESVDDLEWADIREQAWKFNDDGTFVSFPGLEWTKKQGHCNLLDPPTRLWPQDTPRMYREAARLGVVGMYNHSGDGTAVHDGLAYDAEGDKAMQLIEVRQDEEERGYIRALDNGWHVAPAGTDDTHSPNWGNAGRWTVVLAPGLSRVNVWEALRSRHCYATRDRNCRVYFWINQHMMGDIIEQPVQQVTLAVDVADPDEGDTIAKIELFEDGKVIQSVEPGATEKRWELGPDPAPGAHYYFVKVTQADGQQIWTAPIWLAVGEN